MNQTDKGNTINIPTWESIWNKANNEIEYTLKLVSVQASGWALGKSTREIETEARRRLQEGD